MENFKSVFSESYQSIYCRAKSIMDKEEEVGGPSGLRKTKYLSNSLAHRTTWLRSDLVRRKDYGKF